MSLHRSKPRETNGYRRRQSRPPAVGRIARCIVVNIGKENVGRTLELAIDHGVITFVDTDTGEILADQRLDTTREYQCRKLPANANHAPRQYTGVRVHLVRNSWQSLIKHTRN